MKHRCPTKGCVGQTTGLRVVCRDCWRRLPAELQTAVWRAWDDDDRDARIAAARVAIEWLREHPAACDAAAQ